MGEASGRFVNSRMFLLLSIVTIGSLWGLVEATAGVGLRGSCARLYSGSVLTGTSLLFFSFAYMLTGRLLLVLLLPIIAGLLRLYAGLLLGQPVVSGAVANPIFAFFMEALAFCAVIYLLKRSYLRSVAGGGVAGMTAATLSACMFLPVKLVTGIPACVVPGTTFPLAIWGLPVAAAVAVVSMPLGLWAGAWGRDWMEAPGPRPVRVLAGVSAFVSVGVLLALTVIHAR